MIARHETQLEKHDIWAQLSAALPQGVISWRQDGKPVQREGRWIARFVAYIDANTVRERLDAVVPGEWDLTLELLPAISGLEEDSYSTSGACSFKARLQILGVIREDVGTGKDYKSAATDAFKRAAVRFGIGHELYDYEQNWVQVDGDGKYAKPLEDPGTAYARRHGKPAAVKSAAPKAAAKAMPAAAPATALPIDVPVEVESVVESESPLATPAAGPLASEEQSCPKCGGRMWDNRATKRNPKAPDYKCRDRSCDGVIWPPRGEKGDAPAAPAAAPTTSRARAGAASKAGDLSLGGVASIESEIDDLPF